MHRGTSFPILSPAKTKWDQCIEHRFNVQGGPPLLQHNNWQTTRISPPLLASFFGRGEGLCKWGVSGEG